MKTDRSVPVSHAYYRVSFSLNAGVATVNHVTTSFLDLIQRKSCDCILNQLLQLCYTSRICRKDSLGDGTPKPKVARSEPLSTPKTFVAPNSLDHITNVCVVIDRHAILNLGPSYEPRICGYRDHVRLCIEEDLQPFQSLRSD
ncbi:hypothetical protein BLNAU_11696 [Blattamonas nauphoetae]|uniref:Uncharacterized protein n=1 Tax=Blattamonas nauphoetae TaxID=2049346 RepID=A0ABQ9XSD8_9EUKA|nr:hypothetical protein BLNAU_11696 [Blattamonas nauphoetae]